MLGVIENVATGDENKKKSKASNLTKNKPLWY